MRVQRSRTDAVPLTWEVPAALAGGWLILALVALPTVQGAACLASGAGFPWPQGALVESVLGLLAGTPGEGLTDRQATAIPSTYLVYGAVTLIELILAAVAGCGLALWWRSAGPGAQVGLAARHQVRHVLGPSNLHRRRTTIRPDLPGRNRRILPRRGRA